MNGSGNLLLARSGQSLPLNVIQRIAAAPERFNAADARRALGLPEEPRFHALVEGDEGQLHIYDEIGGWFGISPKRIVDAIQELKDQGAKRLAIYLNSPGGDVFDGQTIFNELKRFSGAKTVHIDGLAASMASVIAMVGDRVVMGEGSMLMIHNPWGMGIGDGRDLRKVADLLDQLRQNTIDIYARASGQKAEDIGAWMDGETWMGGALAKERGFVDEVADTPATADPALPAPEQNAAFPLRGFKNAPAGVEKLLSREPRIAKPAPPRQTFDPAQLTAAVVRAVGEHRNELQALLRR